MGDPHEAHLMASCPIPSTLKSGHIFLQLGHCFATYGSSIKHPSREVSTPTEAAFDLTSIFPTVMSIESLGRAPFTATGFDTSCPPLMLGVIIGPQHPGAVRKVIDPPSLIGPSSVELGPIIPFVKTSTKISS